MLQKTKMYNTENGVVLTPTKVFGENEVPAGCYYDEGEVSEALESMLNHQIFPFLNRLEKRLRFELEETRNSIKFIFWLINEPVLKDATVVEMEDHCKQWLQRWPPERFEFYINIECNDSNSGSQLNVYYDKIRFVNMEETHEYPVHMLGIGRKGKESVSQSVDERFTSEQFEQVYQWIIRDLNS